jgi:hypothetical protein
MTQERDPLSARPPSSRSPSGAIDSKGSADEGDAGDETRGLNVSSSPTLRAPGEKEVEENAEVNEPGEGGEFRIGEGRRESSGKLLEEALTEGEEE